MINIIHHNNNSDILISKALDSCCAPLFDFSIARKHQYTQKGWVSWKWTCHIVQTISLAPPEHVQRFVDTLTRRCEWYKRACIIVLGRRLPKDVIQYVLMDFLEYFCEPPALLALAPAAAAVINIQA